ncbi:MAG: ribosomal protein S18-alanine N-acetyltransferase [Acidimicrobiales bacterium]
MRSLFHFPHGAHAGNASPGAGEPGSVELQVLPMHRRHLRGVMAIERRIFPTPWSEMLYLSEMSQPSTRAYYVACVGSKVVGYGGMMDIVGEAHVTNIGVAPEWQRQGVARRLLLQLAREARRRHDEHMTLEVRVSNLGAQALYHEFGFVPAGIRKNYYSEVQEDGLVMWANDIGTDAYAERLEGIESRLRPVEAPGRPPWVAPGEPEK